MDQYTQAAMAYLRSKRGVRNVVAESTNGVSELEIAKWEDQNLPHELPEDYKSLLRVSNGFRMKWDLLFRGEPVQMGDMCINQLKDLAKVDLNISTKDDREPLESYLNMKRDKLPLAAFSVDKHCKCGNVALVYSDKEIGSKEVPEVWFQDLGGRWSFLAPSFIVYFRMMVAHLGLPNWQYRFTEHGMDPISKQWFHLVAPEKFTFDLNEQTIKAKQGQQTKAGSERGTKGTNGSSSSTGGSTQKMKSLKGDSLKVGRSGSSTRTSSNLSSGFSSAKDRAASSRRKKQQQQESKDFLRSYRIRPKSAFN